MEKEKKILSFRLRKETKWLAKYLERERKKNNSPSIANTIETILVKHFESIKPN